MRIGRIALVIIAINFLIGTFTFIVLNSLDIDTN
jgi:hypothetical protein